LFLFTLLIFINQPALRYLSRTNQAWGTGRIGQFRCIDWHTRSECVIIIFESKEDIEMTKKSRVWMVGVLAAALLAALWLAGASRADSPAGAASAGAALAGSAPTMLSYQGVVKVNGGAYEGTGYFKFAVVGAAGGNGTNYWANDGTASGEPTGVVALTVSGGLFNVLLGDTSLAGMSQGIDETVFASDTTYLRVWFSETGTGGTFEALEPNQRIASGAYALSAESVDGFHASSVPTANTLIALDGSGYLRVPRLLDSNNTDYYVDPAGTSLFYNVDVRNVLYNGISGYVTVDDGVKAKDFGVNGTRTDSGYYVTDVAANDVDYGVFVSNVDVYGVYVVSAGNAGIRVYAPAGDGVQVAAPGDNGVYVSDAGADGVHVTNPGGDGVQVTSPTFDGLVVSNAGDDGVQVTSPVDDGVYVVSAGNDGVYVNGTGDDGVQVSNAGDDGVYVSSAGGVGVEAHGVMAGGYFEDSTSGIYAWVAYSIGSSNYGILSNGTKNFVQEHPKDPSQAIVYAALEGGEAGTYYRGSAQLANGEAVIELPEHFSLVTEEEGLTVQVTPREDCNGLYVAQVTTTQIVVKELQGGTSNARFDFFINGVRAGFADFQVMNSMAELGLTEMLDPEPEGVEFND
jgi:hypothetical protein